MDVAASDRVVGDKGRFVRNHVIYCSCVGNQETWARPELVGAIECARGLLRRAKTCFWKLNCTSASDVDGRGVAVAGSSRVEVGTCVVGRDVKSTWIHGNVEFRVSATSGIHFPSFFLS